MVFLTCGLQEGEAPVTPTTPNPKASKKEKEKEKEKDKDKAADDDDDGTWTVDVSEAAVRARMQGTTNFTVLTKPCFDCC